MFRVNFAARCSRPLGLMQSAAMLVGKSTYKSTAVETTQNFVASKATDEFEKDYSRAMVENACVVGKQNLSF